MGFARSFRSPPDRVTKKTMYRLAYRAFRLSSGSQYWTRRRFTPAGRFVMACLIVSSVLGIDTDLTLTYQVFTLSLTLLSLCCWWPT
jgi:hypothetical protein